MGPFSRMFSLTQVALSLLFLSGSSVASEKPHRWEKRQSGTFAITGAPGSTQPRLEIRQLQANADQWNLYLLALNDYRWQDQSALLSYYQVAGIHGVPNVAWDGVQGNPTNGAVGYCTHVSPLFPAWHRAYVALFEQAFFNSVNNVVNQFQGADRQRYQTAAATLRIPYWDWAAPASAGQPVLPTAITDKFVTVQTPSGPQNWINPLFRFDTHPLDHAGFLDDPWDNWAVTLRYPNSSDPVAVSSQNNQAVSTMNSDNPNLRNRIYKLFSSCNDYQGFSNAASDARSDACQDSLESIHNNIHNDVGGPNGHMTILWYAALDPSFWLHHANVDRLFALWQAMNPTSYTVNANTEQATFAISSGTHVDNSFGLAPFHSDANGNLHTTDSVRDVTSFKYTYPELASGDTSPAGVRAKFNQLYAGGGGNSRSKRGVHHRRQVAPFPTSSGAGRAGAAYPTGTKTPWLAPSGATNTPIPSAGKQLPNLPSNDSALLTPTTYTDMEYTANIACQGFALGGSYNVYVFLGSPASEAPTSWASDSNLCGTHSNFAAPGMTTKTLVTGDIPLTSSLVDRLAVGQLASLNKNITLPYLTKNLQWRVMKSDGTSVPNDKVPGLSVAVRSAPVKAASSDSEFPSFGKWEDHQECTHGKPGGVQQGMASNWYSMCSPAPS